MAIRRVTYEQSPIATFLDFEMPRLMAASASAEREREHELVLEEKRNERALNVAAWQSNEQRLTNLQDQFISAGLKVKPEFKTSGYADLSQNILGDTKEKSQNLLNTIQEGDTQISWMEDQLAELQAGRTLIEQKERDYAARGQTAEDAGAASYMLEGGFKQTEDGAWVPAVEGSEVDLLFKDLQPEQATRFANDAFRTGFMSGRRTEEEARTLMKLDQDVQLSKIQLAGAEEDINQKRYESAIGKLDDASTQLQLGFKNYGNTYAGQITLGNTSYGMIQLLELDDQVDVFTEFREMMHDGVISESVYNEAVSGIMSLRQASASKDPYPERYFVKMAAKAYDDIIAHQVLDEKVLVDPSFKDSDEYRKSSKVVRSWRNIGIGRDMHQLEKAKDLYRTYELVEETKLNTILGETELQAGGIDLEEIGIDPEILNAAARGENKFTAATGITDEGDPYRTYGDVIIDPIKGAGSALLDAFGNLTGAGFTSAAKEQFDYLFNTPIREMTERGAEKRTAETFSNIPGIGPIYGEYLKWLDPSLFKKE